MQRIECWRLESVNIDDPNSLVARFQTEQEAEKAKEAASGYGPEIRYEEIVIWDSALEFDPKRFDPEAKASALSKLSPREKAALGLTTGPEA